MLTYLDILLSEVQALLDDRKYPKVFDDMTDKDDAIVEKSSYKILKVMEKYDLIYYQVMRHLFLRIKNAYSSTCKRRFEKSI